MDIEKNQINEEININENKIKNTINNFEKIFSFKPMNLMDINME